MTRIIAGSPIAALVTFTLFMLMAYLIKMNEEPMTSGESVLPKIKIIRDVLPPEDPRPVPKRPEKKPPTELPEIEMPKSAPIPIEGDGSGITLPGFDPKDSVGVGLNTPTKPVIAIPPTYPQRAITAGIEGWCIVGFDVSPLGQAENIHVIDRFPTSVFDNASMKAIKKWRFEPKVVNGKAVWQRGKEHKFWYEFED